VAARRAAAAGNETDAEVPFGFATRVLARAAQPPSETWEDLVSAIGKRVLLVTACLAVIAAGIGYADWYDVRLERPRFEQSLTSDLPWP
jgi:hypothetical protein